MKGMRKRSRVAFSFYLLISLIVTLYYIFIYGYSFWYTAQAAVLVNISACMIFLTIMYLQFNPIARVWSWLLMAPGFALGMFSFSGFERFDVNVIYLGVMLTVVMMILAALLNWFFARDNNSMREA